MVQYYTTVGWDVTLIDATTVDTDTAPAALQGLVNYAVKITTGAPAATAGKFIRGAIISNAISGVNYQNTGTTASPVWSVIDVSSGGLPALPDGDVWIGNALNVATAVTLSGDVTVTNAGVTTVDAIDLETATVTNIASTEILIGTGAGTAAFAAMSGDATMDNAGVVTVTGATGGFAVGGNVEVTGGYLVPGGVRFAPLYPIGSLPQALTGAGAINLTTYQTQFTPTAPGDALTLADASQIGHVKKISYVAGAAGTGVITPATVTGYATVTLNAIGDYVVFAWTGAAWTIVEYFGATVA